MSARYLIKACVVRGFSYQNQETCEKTWAEWQSDIRRVESAGGYSRRIGDDLIAFDSHGRMLFEVYDNDARVAA